MAQKGSYGSSELAVSGPQFNTQDMASEVLKNSGTNVLEEANARYANMFSPDANVPWYKNGDTLSGYAGLASALTGIAGFRDQRDLLKTQTEGLKQNIAFAKEDQARRNNNIAGFNSFRPSSPVSAFASNL
jgi:hypothetical protein